MRCVGKGKTIKCNIVLGEVGIIICPRERAIRCTSPTRLILGGEASFQVLGSQCSITAEGWWISAFNIEALVLTKRDVQFFCIQIFVGLKVRETRPRLKRKWSCRKEENSKTWDLKYNLPMKAEKNTWHRKWSYELGLSQIMWSPASPQAPRTSITTLMAKSR